MVEFEASVIAVQERNASDLHNLAVRMSLFSGQWKAVAWEGIDQAFLYNDENIDLLESRTLANSLAKIEDNGLPISYPQRTYSQYVPVEMVFQPEGSTNNDTQISLLSVHPLYAYEEERLKQAKWLSFYVYDWLAAHSNQGKIIVAGDFNAAPWSQTGQNMLYKKGPLYIPRLNGYSSYYDHIYANQKVMDRVVNKTSFVITPSQYGEDASSFFKEQIGEDWYMTYSDHYPVFIDYELDP